MNMYDLTLLCSEYIMDCTNSHLPVQSRRFQELCYEKWAVSMIQAEIAIKVFPNDYCPISEIIPIVSEFSKRMKVFAYKDKKAKIIFVTAQNVATDILDILRSML